MNVQLPPIVAALAKHQEKNDSNSHLVASSIITALGGTTNVVKLCVTHPDSIANNQYYENVISSLHQILQNASNASSPTSIATRNIINSDTAPNDITNGPANQKFKFNKIRTISPSLSTNMNDNDKNNVRSTGVDNTVNSNCNQQSATSGITQNTVVVHVDNTKQFYKSSVVFNAHVCNNCFYKWFSNDKANWCVNLILYNKWYSIVTTLVAFILAAASELDQTINGTNTVSSSILAWMSYCICSIFALSLIGVMNLDIIEIATKTFDFWFKMWNLMIWDICYGWIYFETTDRRISELIGTILTVSAVVLAFSLMDAIPLKYKLNKIIVGAALCFYLGFFVRAYFIAQDVYYNPFGKYNIKHTRISLKSTFLGAYINIALFVGKPVLIDISKWFVGKICKYRVTGKNATNVNKIAIEYERLFSIYKRPKVKWNYYNNDMINIKSNSTS